MAGIAGPLIINRILDARGAPSELVAADYQPALFTMVAVLARGFVANLWIRPVSECWQEKPAATTAAGAESGLIAIKIVGRRMGKGR